MAFPFICSAFQSFFLDVGVCVCMFGLELFGLEVKVHTQGKLQQTARLDTCTLT